MTNNGLILKRDVDLRIKHEAFEFQKEAVDALKDKEYGAVFHEQGLGKTKIAIDILIHWLKEGYVDSVLIVTKKGLIVNWQNELKSHTHLNPRLLSQDKVKNFAILNSPARVYLSHYEVLNSENKRLLLFLKTRRIGVIFDESQKIKNPGSKLAQSAFELSNGFVKKLILTGTPIANRPYDIWAQIYFLDNGESLGKNFAQFKDKLDLDSNLKHNANRRLEFENSLNDIFLRISSFTVRDTKDGGRISLPNKEIVRHYCDWESKQYELYNDIRDKTSAVIVQDGIPTEDISEDILKRLLRLVQVSSNPRIIDDSYVNIPGKFVVLEELVDEVIRNDEKAIIWSSFTKNVDWLKKQLVSYNPVKVHGKLTYEDRNLSIEKFKNDKDVKLLIATPGAAKEGFTLTMANHVIFYDRSFSLDDYLQAQDRIHRISQTKTCYVHNLIMNDSIDEWVDALISIKHLSAKLAQGDISLEDYSKEVTYDFSDVLDRILGKSN